MDILSVLQIPLWQLRRPLPGAKPSSLLYSAYALYDTQELLCGYWVLKKLDSPEQMRLMEKIIDAFKDRRHVHAVPHEAALASLCQHIPVLAMGNVAAAYYQSYAPSITYHPAELLEQPAHKAPFWQAINAFIGCKEKPAR